MTEFGPRTDIAPAPWDTSITGWAGALPYMPTSRRGFGR